MASSSSQLTCSQPSQFVDIEAELERILECEFEVNTSDLGGNNEEDENKHEKIAIALDRLGIVAMSYNQRIKQHEYTEKIKEELDELCLEAKILQTFYVDFEPEKLPPISLRAIVDKWVAIKSVAVSLMDINIVEVD